MFIVDVKDISIDRALKILKNKVVKTGMLKELRKRQEFVKKSVRRREQIKKAIYVQELKNEEMMKRVIKNIKNIKENPTTEIPQAIKDMLGLK